ncbi:uncharacterized protein A1O5_03154, partial [Cladophialophora psammophila CBS 110553]
YRYRNRQTMQNSMRFENAQKRHALNTLNPATLNWWKERDLTWLYGPWQSESRGPGEVSNRGSPDALSSLPSVHRKPIWKWKSTSAAILGGVQSQISLLQRADGLLRAQLETSTVVQQRESSTDPTANFSSFVRSATSTLPEGRKRYSFANSQPPTPCEIEHGRFNDQVQQIE